MIASIFIVSCWNYSKQMEVALLCMAAVILFDEFLFFIE